MKIARIDTALASIPLARPVITPIHHIDAIDNVLVTVASDAGIEGIAYLWCFGKDKARALAALVHDLGRVVIGADPRQTGALWTRMWNEANFLGRAGATMFAQSALDTAIWDIKARAAGEPLWRMLGGSPTPIPAYANGLFLSDPLDAVIAEARAYVTAGFRGVKMRTGSRQAHSDIERVEAIREAIGPHTALMIDVVQGWSAEHAIRVGREIARFDITWIEDPVAFDDHRAMAQVAAALDIPLCAGENDYGCKGFARLIDGACIDIAMADLQRAGGVTEWLRIATLAQTRGLPITSHVFHEVSLHLMATLARPYWMEHMGWWEGLFNEPVRLTDGCLVPPERPGIGMTFNWDRIETLRFT